MPDNRYTYLVTNAARTLALNAVQNVFSIGLSNAFDTP
jgi:hypothetical protein